MVILPAALIGNFKDHVHTQYAPCTVYVHVSKLHVLCMYMLCTVYVLYVLNRRTVCTEPAYCMY